MGRRGKRVLVALALVALVGGGVAFAVWRAPPVDLIPVATKFLTGLDEGRTPEALQGSLMHDRWDLSGLLESNAVRQRRLGRLLRVESVGPQEEVTLPPGMAHGPGRRMRLRAVFERGTNEVLFTFARRGSTWMVRDFEFESWEPPERPGLEQHMRRMGKTIGEDLGNSRWPTVHGRLLRADRIANPLEFWAPRISPNLDSVGGFKSVEERAWKFEAGRATLAARLTFESTHRDVDLDLFFDPTEGRVVVTRMDFLP